MELSHDLIADFTKALKPVAEKKNSPIMYGTVVVSDGKTYVKIDGSDQLTPFTSATAVSQDERVLVTIQDHTAIVTGNISSPAAKDTVVTSQAVSNNMVMASTYLDSVITKFADVREILAAAVEAGTVDTKHLEAIEAEIEKLQADYGKFENIDVDKLRALSATIDKLYAEFGQFDHIEADELDAIKADIQVLRSYTGTFTHLSAHDFEAIKATVQDLKVKNAEIVFANIGSAKIENGWFNTFFANSGMVKDLTLENGTVVKELVGVYISGDVIKANTLQADSLIVRGDDGLYYKLNVSALGQAEVDKLSVAEQEKLKNGIHGSNIIAKTIVAEQIKADDLTAFKASLANFKIGIDDETGVGYIYSEPKSALDNGTAGIYLDSDGQMNIGDGSNYIKFYYDTAAGEWKLDIAAESIRLAAREVAKQEVDSAVNTAYNKVGSRGDQLVTNGNGIMGDNTNFTGLLPTRQNIALEFDGSVTNNTPGSFTLKQHNNDTPVSDELFVVDPNKEYTLSMDARSREGAANLYGFIACYDVDMKSITVDQCGYMPDTHTTLVKALEKDDDCIIVDDASSWVVYEKDKPSTYTQPSKNKNTIRFWCWENSQGYRYPAQTYTRISTKMYPASEDPACPDSYSVVRISEDDPEHSEYAGKYKIMLNQKWTGYTNAKGEKIETIPANVEVSQGRSGATYKYAVGNAKPPKGAWKTYSGKYSGVDYTGTNASGKFPPATAYANVGFIWNNVKADDQLWVTNISVKETSVQTAVSQAQTTATQAKTAANTAQTTANNASQAANTAQTTADSANSAANSANNKIDNLKIGARNLIRNSDDLIFSAHNFTEGFLSNIVESQQAILAAQDVILGTITVVTPESVIFTDLETELGNYLVRQQEILTKINELPGGDVE